MGEKDTGRRCRKHCMALTRRSISGFTGGCQPATGGRSQSSSSWAASKCEQCLHALLLVLRRGFVRQIREANVLDHLYRHNRCRYHGTVRYAKIALSLSAKRELQHTHQFLSAWLSITHQPILQSHPVPSSPVPSAIPMLLFSETDATDIHPYRYVVILDCTH